MTRIVFIGDVHVGSNYAIFPEDFRNPEDGSPVGTNQHQKRLYSFWCQLAEKLSPVDIIILMGDLIEGPQTKERFGTLKLQNVAHQAEAFIKMFGETWKWKQLYVVRGTPYHVTVEGVEIEEWIARRLGAAKVDSDRYSAVDHTIKIHGRVINAAHHLSVSMVPHYRATPLAREMWLARMFIEYFSRIDVVARAHVHYFQLLQIEDILWGFTTPSWQLPTPYQRKKTVFGSNASIGLVEMEIEEDGDISIRPHLAKGLKPRIVELKLEEGGEGHEG